MVEIKKWMHGYAVELHQLKEEGGGGFLAYIVEMGHSACSNVGDTIQEALEELEGALEAVLEVMKEGGTRIPEPQGDPAEEPRCNLTSVSQQLWYRPTDPAVLAQVQHVIRHKQLAIDSTNELNHARELLARTQAKLKDVEDEAHEALNRSIEAHHDISIKHDLALQRAKESPVYVVHGDEAHGRVRAAMDMLRRIEWVQEEHAWGWVCPKCRKYECSWKEVEERTHKPDCELAALLHPEEQVDYDTPAMRLLSDMASRECESPKQCGETIHQCLSCRARDLIGTDRVGGTR